MSERSTLQMRVRPHFRPDREEDIVVEVVREGEVVATIYGSREGVQIVSELIAKNQPPFGLRVSVGEDSSPSYVIPLLKPGEECPWCAEGVTLNKPCPVCRKD
jgi:hypothetical protein